MISNLSMGHHFIVLKTILSYKVIKYDIHTGENTHTHKYKINRKNVIITPT